MIDFFSDSKYASEMQIGDVFQTSKNSQSYIICAFNLKNQAECLDIYNPIRITIVSLYTYDSELTLISVEPEIKVQLKRKFLQIQN